MAFLVVWVGQCITKLFLNQGLSLVTALATTSLIEIVSAFVTHVFSHYSHDSVLSVSYGKGVVCIAWYSQKEPSMDQITPNDTLVNQQEIICGTNNITGPNFLLGYMWKGFASVTINNLYKDWVYVLNYHFGFLWLYCWVTLLLRVVR